MFNIQYIRNQEKIKTRAIAKILSEQQSLFCSMLENEKKDFIDDVVNNLIDETKSEIPNYLVETLPTIMNKALSEKKNQYKQIPDNYNLSFDIETSPASEYIRNLEELHLSQRDWSINKTTNDELRRIIAQWIDDWFAYWWIAKQIKETNPFVFSKARANLIAVQEVWQAYWFANYQPMLDMNEQYWFIFEKLWVTNHDGKVRATHLENEGMWWIPMDKEFVTWDMYAPSHDFRCRCYMKDKVVDLKCY